MEYLCREFNTVREAKVKTDDEKTIDIDIVPVACDITSGGTERRQTVLQELLCFGIQGP